MDTLGKAEHIYATATELHLAAQQLLYFCHPESHGFTERM